MAQELLRDSWLRGQHGRLCAWEQAKALALREASRELHGRTQLAWIAARVEKVGGGHPSDGALRKFLQAAATEPPRSCWKPWARRVLVWQCHREAQDETHETMTDVS